jgi:hypothetical protein
MLVILPTHDGDVSLAYDLIKWIAELGGCHKHTLSILPHASLVGGRRLGALLDASVGVFNSTRLLAPVERLADEKWPLGANHMFRSLLKRDLQRPFLWMEPDCEPTRPGWLDEIDAEYKIALAAGKSFMGHKVFSNKKGLPRESLAGCAVYPADCAPLLARLGRNDIAFDIAIAPYVMERAHITPLIWQFWGQKDLPPTFLAETKRGASKNSLTLAAIPEKCALFHRCKDQSLELLLRAKLFPPAKSTTIEV